MECGIPAISSPTSAPVTADPLRAALGLRVGILAVGASLAEADGRHASWLDRRFTPNSHIRAVLAEARMGSIGAGSG